ncbi:hypothetical protein BKA58DRAFT_378061 [Alternaria rosae]|uniref:uncharacterized protein n=1 Tax=Alternaria rosae TaxID=1187941 RepID=UPI001E8DEAFD|nr:uncharacterized protein BKA58DRAFT_378061 [Alternaria rosae]KAH6878837.1 hypothetical protein BKA58DRAFT_378061 [Alternaria rosae]
MELHIPITISHKLLALSASIAIATLNCASLAKVSHIVIFLASAALYVLRSLYEYAQIWELQRQTEELRAKTRRYRAQRIALEIAIEELYDGFDDLDNEAKILVMEDKIKMLQDFADRTGILED